MIRHHSHNLPNNLLSNALQMNGKRRVTYDFFFPSFEMKIQTNDSSKEFIGFFIGDFILTIISFQTSFLTEKPGSVIRICKHCSNFVLRKNSTLRFQCRFQTRNIEDGVSVALGGGRDGSSPIALGLRYSNNLNNHGVFNKVMLVLNNQ